MPSKQQLIRRKEYLWEIPTSVREDMRVPAYVYATEEGLEDLLQDQSLEQLINVTTLPGIRKAAIAMPDAHQGYGFPIGGVAATSYPDGTISPGGIGYDINCGVRLLSADIQYDEIKGRVEELSKALFRKIPAGAGKSGPLKLSPGELKQLLKEGPAWLVKRGYGKEDDLKHIESEGCLEFADPDAVSHKALERGSNQVGTLGGGNHFMEVDRVSNIFDDHAANKMGLRKGQVVFLIHSGSRGFGHQIATEYTRKFRDKLPEYGIELPDRGLACAPMNTPDGRQYYHCMGAAANFAWSNREMLTREVRQAWSRVFCSHGGEIDVVYDISHNIAKIEEHTIDGEKQQLIVHRKGATRSFGPGHPDLPEDYREIGQPVMIPGSMGTSSYVLAGTKEGMEETFGSTCHGAGRRLSRTEAKSKSDAGTLIRELKEQGIYVQAGSKKGVAEEAPLAYKDENIVVDTVEKAGIARKVARLRPVAVIKG